MEQITITKPDGSQINLNSKETGTYVTKGEQKRTLLAEDTVSISLSSMLPLNIEIGDKAVFFGKTYKINKPVTPTKKGESQFEYDIEFESVQYDLLDVMYFDCDAAGLFTRSDFALTGNLRFFLEVLINNTNRVFGSGIWFLGECPETDYKDMTFSNQSCLAVLQSLCEKDNGFNQEFDIVSIDGVNTINIRQQGVVLETAFEYGKGNGLYSIKRQAASDSNILTKLFAFGGTTNLKSGYRNFSTRLKLPVMIGNDQSCIQNDLAVKLFGVKEATKEFDDIYPNRIGTVSSISDNILEFFDTSMNFDLKEKDSEGNTKWLVNGTSPKIHFNTGNLAGYEFDTDYDHSTKMFTIKSYKDERGTSFPSLTNTAFRISAGDKYVILNIVLPDSYVTEAESKLLVEAQKYLKDNSRINVQYSLTIDELYLVQINNNIEVECFAIGDSLHLKDSDFKIDDYIRIQSFTRDILKPFKYTLTLSNTVQVTRIERVFNALKQTEKVIKMNNLLDPAKARRSWKDMEEMKNMVFDPDGQYFTDKIKPLSIDTSLLTVGTRAGNLTLSSTFTANYSNDKAKFFATTGVLAHLSIESNVRQWTMSQLYVTGLIDTNAYYLYARCPIAGTTGTFVLDTEIRKIDNEGSYYTFPIGIVHSVNEGYREVSLTYGSAAIYGRSIKAGQVVNTQGEVFLDIDKREIYGKVTFKASDGSYKDVAAVDTAAATAQNTADNIQIGGRNLIKGTVKLLNLATAVWVHYPLSSSLVEGNTYILGGYFDKGTSGVVCLNKNDYNASKIDLPLNTPFVATLAMSTCTHFAIANQTGATPVIAKNPKLEIGNRSTDYTVAPEDVDTVIATAQTTANNASTAAASAQTDASNALGQLTNITSDNVLSSAEKPSQRQEWNVISAEKAGINSQATAFSITTENTAYNTAFQSLATYLNAGTAWTTGVPAWLADANLSTNTTIVGTTYRTNWQTFYSAKTALLQAISTKAKALADAAQIQANTATNNAATAQTTANNAASTASAAATDASNALGQLTNITSDNVLSSAEKPSQRQEWNVISAEKAGINSQATAFGITTENTAYNTAFQSLATYLNAGTAWTTGVPAWLADANLSVNTTIVGSTYRTNWQTFYSAKTALLQAISTKAKALADAAQIQANTATNNAATAQTTANNAASTASAAATDASNALGQLTNITSDNVLSSAEKPSQRQEWNVISAEKAGINSQATAFGITTENTAYNTAFQSLATYLNAGTAWTTGVPMWLSDANLSVNTTIVGTTYRTNWQTFYSAKTALLQAISTKAKALADAAQIQANTATNNAATAQTTANNAASTASAAATDASNALGQLTNITSDNVLSSAEKPSQRQEWNVISAEKAGINSQATAFGITTENTAYNTAFQSLATYLNAGTAWTTGVPAWLADANLSVNTTIVGSTYRTNWQTFYSAKTALLQAISTKAKALADAAQIQANTATNNAATAQTTANNAASTASAAATDASNALGQLTNITSDNVLSSAEKPSQRQEWNVISAEKAGINSQATAFGITTENTAYNTAFQSLATYLNAGTAWTTGVPMWLSDANLSVNTTIVGSTYRTNWQTFYNARTALLQAISTKAKALADAAQSTADNIQIGGRNLVLNSARVVTATVTSYTLSKNLNTLLGQDITISYDYSYSNVTTGSAYNTNRIGNEIATIVNGNNYYLGAWIQLPASSSGLSDSGRAKFTVTIPSGTSNSITSASLYIQVVSGTVQLSNFKIEVGNRATDYTVAPRRCGRHNRSSTKHSRF